VLPRLAYLTLCRSIRLLALLAHGDAAKELEILVLRHQLMVLRRQTPLSGLTLEPVRPVNHDQTRSPCSWFGARFTGSGGALSRGLMLLPLPWLSERCHVPANPAQVPMSGTRAPSSLRLDPRDDGHRLRRAARRSERTS
jgi:hypothetical protein